MAAIAVDVFDSGHKILTIYNGCIRLESIPYRKYILDNPPKWALDEYYDAII